MAQSAGSPDECPAFSQVYTEARGASPVVTYFFRTTLFLQLQAGDTASPASSITAGQPGAVMIFSAD